jgi:hypothetical protein
MAFRSRTSASLIGAHRPLVARETSRTGCAQVALFAGVSLLRILRLVRSSHRKQCDATRRLSSNFHWSFQMSKSVVFSARPRTVRSPVAGATALSLCLAVAIAQAQVPVVSPNTDPTQGRAPVVTINSIVNETDAGQSPTVGDVLRAEASATDPDGDTITQITYRWLRGVAEVGSNQTYTVDAADSAQGLAVEVTATTSPSVTDPSSGVATGAIAVTNSPPTMSKPTIHGTMEVGSTLTGTPHDYADVDNDPEGTHLYQWYRADNAAATINKIVIPGATSTTYLLAPADQLKFMVFEVTPKSTSGADTGAPVTDVTGNYVNGRPPLVTGVAINNTTSPVVSQDLTVQFTYSDPDTDAQGAHLYQWFRSGNAISGATNRTYRVTTSDIGQILTARMTPRSATGDPIEGAPVTTPATQAAVAIPAPLVVTELGRAVSRDFRPWMQTGTGCFIVPSQSTASGPSTGCMNSGANPVHSIVSVNAGGAVIRLRAMRLVHTVNSNWVAMNDASNSLLPAILAFEFNAADNPGLPSGTYSQTFNVQVKAYQASGVETPYLIPIDMRITIP